LLRDEEVAGAGINTVLIVPWMVGVLTRMAAGAASLDRFA